MFIRKIPIIAFLLVSFFQFAYCQNFNSKKEEFVIAEPAKQLNVGEHLTYSLQWLGIPLGWVTLEVKEITFIAARPCYHIIASARTNKFFRRFRDVEYTVHTYIDVKEFYPWRFEKQKRFRGGKSDLILDFNHDKNQAIYTDLFSQKSSSIEISSLTQDVLSSLYYFRKLDIRKQGSYNMDVLYETKRWKINIKIEDIKSLDIRKTGSFKVFVAKMSTEFSQHMLGKKEIEVYFNIDARRIPVKFVLHSMFGHIDCILTETRK
jgi:hypothetical protein